MKVRLRHLTAVFFKLGALGFGGPLALIALMEKEFVDQLKWISRQTFEENFLYCKMLPGPVAYQMALSIGREVRGTAGALCAGTAFLLPAFTLMLALCIGYEYISGVHWMNGFIMGMRLGAVVVIIESVWRLAKPYQKQADSWIYVAVGAVVTFLIPRMEIFVILGCGLVSMMMKMKKPKLVAVNPISVGLLLQLFLVHAKCAFLVFGTGLAVLPVLQSEAVGRGWVTTQQFIDGIAFGQITPGPITITSVFIGYEASSLIGAFTAFLGMYSPGLLLILVVVPWIRRKLSTSEKLLFFQKGALPAVIGCLFGASLLFVMATVQGWYSLVICAVLAVLSFGFRSPSWLTILIGSGIGFAFQGVFR